MQSIQREVDLLQRMGRDGVAAEAFGCDIGRGGLSAAAPNAPSWDFVIVDLGGLLEARVDLYSATWQGGVGEFDPEKWEAMTLRFNAPATRKGFRALASLCRSLLAGLVTTLTNQHGTYHMDLEGVTFFRADGRVLVQTWEEFLEVPA
ncbi:hypothetical protein PSEUDO8Z_160365 [Pseudomonas sp. 8Z]|uniref:hypothetical protein n=1 Tax=Pseudomonas sp. 8Z TaxID=2653166 RepID=UPI0012F06B41|nr:hypothetical protein [Pseudomonas sp. 8Z]VXC72725.1 hypothetical protein PSEUDO8Z_160365 [Pseudomonas sp. 8Z]